jgi:hypothetical protein
MTFPETLGAPEILEEQPSNVTVQNGKAAVFQCRVHSKARPNFYWLRRTDGRASNDVLIPLLNNTYEVSIAQFTWFGEASTPLVTY